MIHYSWLFMILLIVVVMLYAAYMVHISRVDNVELFVTTSLPYHVPQLILPSLSSTVVDIQTNPISWRTPPFYLQLYYYSKWHTVWYDSEVTPFLNLSGVQKCIPHSELAHTVFILYADGIWITYNLLTKQEDTLHSNIYDTIYQPSSNSCIYLILTTLFEVYQYDLHTKTSTRQHVIPYQEHLRLFTLEPEYTVICGDKHIYIYDETLVLLAEKSIPEDIETWKYKGGVVMNRDLLYLVFNVGIWVTDDTQSFYRFDSDITHVSNPVSYQDVVYIILFSRERESWGLYKHVTQEITWTKTKHIMTSANTIHLQAFEKEIFMWYTYNDQLFRQKIKTS